MAGGTTAGQGKVKGEMRGKYTSPKAKQGRVPRPKTRLQLTRLAEVSEDEGPAPSMRKSSAKLPVKGGKGIKEASATAESTQAPVPLIPERRTKSASEGRQDVPRSGVGDEAEADANNNQKGTTSKAVRSPKPRVQPIAKNKGVEQQKETVVPSKVPPPEIKKAEKKQGVGKGREKVLSAGFQKPHEDIPAQKTQVVPNKGKEKVVSVGSQKPHEDILAEKTQGVEKGKETVGSSKDPRMEKKKGKKKPGSKKAKGKGSLVKPTEKVQVPKEVKKPKRKDASAAPNLSKASEQPMKRKLPLQAATVGSPSKHVKNFVASRMRKADAMQELKNDAIIRKIRQGYERHRRVRVGYLLSEDEDTAEDSSDQLEEYEKRRPAKVIEKVKKEEKESDLVEIYDSSDEEEARQDQEEAEDEGKEEESGEKEEKSTCEEGEEEEDEGGDEEGADDEEEDGEKAEEEERENDGEKTDEADGGTGNDEDSKDDWEGSGDDGKGDEEGDCVESTDESDEGDGIGASMDGSDEGDGVGTKDEEAEASFDEEATAKQSGGGGTPRAAVALASMKESFALGLSFASMDSLLYVS
ncbi:hypothetical protein L7F22_061582 [Adiantum nelumboides]|nr:hypothetical protein [Adiantum nelumboides]